MNDPGPADVFWLESEEHFDVLSDSTRLEMIELLMRPHSVRELAAQMRVPRTRLYHHVNQLEQAGMIRVVDTRQAGAQTEKIYQVTAYSYQPSERYLEEAMPREKAQAVLAAIFGATEADFIRSVEEGAVTFEDRATRRRLHLRRGLLQLDDERLHQFIADLEAVYDKYDTDHPGDAPDDAQLVATVSLVYPSTRSIR
jgi:DNA-binding transcriptional ArsR family regulator